MTTFKRTGFPYFDSTIILILVALLIYHGAPSLNEIVQTNRLLNQTETLVASLKLARQVSITNQSTVTLCASDNQISCNHSNAWQSGWIVFTDNGRPGVVDGADEILQATHHLERGLTVAVMGEKLVRYTSTTLQTYVCMGCEQPRTHANNKLSGFIQTHLPIDDAVAGKSTDNMDVRLSSSVMGNSEISVCDSTRAGETGRLVVISMIGRVSVANKICD